MRKPQPRSTASSAAVQFDRLRQIILSHRADTMSVLAEADAALESDSTLSGTSAVRALFDAIEGGEAMVAFFGNYSTGKSSMINSLTGSVNGMQLLPTKISPTTATQTVIWHGKKNEAKLRFRENLVVGPLASIKEPTQEQKLLETLTQLINCDSTPVLDVFSKSKADSLEGQRLGERELSSRLGELDQHLAFSRGEYRCKWQFLHLRLRKQAPLVLSLQSKQELDELHRWLAGNEMSLWLDSVDITITNPSIRGMRLVDTPGIDSLMPQHQEITKRRIGQANAIVFTFKSTNPQLHHSERAAYLRLFEWLGPKATTSIFHAGTFADDAIDDLMAEEECGVADAKQMCRDGLVKGFRQVLQPNRAQIQPLKLFLLNASNFRDPRGEADAFIKGLKAYLATANGQALVRENLVKILFELENREAILTSFVKDLSAAVHSQDLSSLERRRSKFQGAADAIRQLGPDIQKRLERAVSNEIRSLRDWVAQAFHEKASAEKLSSKWEQQAVALVESLNQQMTQTAVQLEEVINDAFEATDAKIHLRPVSSSTVALDKMAVESPMSGVTWYLRGFIDLLGFRTQKVPVREAKEVAIQELRRIEDLLKEDAKSSVEEMSKSAAQYLGHATEGLKLIEAQLQDLLGDIDSQKERVAQWESRLQTLRKVRASLKKAGS